MISEPTTSIRLKTNDLPPLIFVAGLSCALWSAVYVGYISSDDMSYLWAAYGWLENGTYVPEHHWGTRHPLILPLALSVAVFGESEVVTAIPSGLATFALVILLYITVLRLFGTRAAVFSSVLIVTMPYVAIWSTIPYPDLIEACFVFASLVAFHRASERNGHLGLLFVAGCLAGFAMQTRETAVSLIACYAVLFVFGIGVDRRRYLMMGVGACLPVGLEWLYYLYIIGDPFHRIHTVLATHGGPGMTMTGHFHSGWGILTTNRFFAPWIAMLFNQEFGLLFWIAVPAIWIVARSGSTSSSDRWIRVLLIICFFYIVGTAYALGLRPLPRYFTVSAIAAAVIIGIWLSRLFDSHPRRSMIVLVALLGVNGLMLDLENKHPTREHQLAAELVRLNPDRNVYTDRQTDSGVHWFLVWAGLEDRVRAEPPPPGALVVYDPDKAKSFPEGFQDGWRMIDRHDAPRTLTGVLLELVGIAPFLEGSAYERLLRQGRPVFVYEVPE